MNNSTSQSQLNFNRLKNEKSLYLRQHGENPIHWWPYGPEALNRANLENKPIFLSIGYSSCHWCHVMAHDSFMSQITAKELNENFICIKVDREEYPDLDNYYQKAAQLFSNNGGWPLSAFLLPDMRPFFVGTYYPAVSKDGGPSFNDLLKELKRAFDQEKEQVEKNAFQVTESIKIGNTNKDKVQFSGHFPPPNGILEAIKEFRDLEWGGYGTAPKFPNFSFYEWAVEQMLEGMVTREQGEFIISSMDKMLMGGINDHARGGIHRYSTDQKWLVPHFEKMLYDQAGFLKTLSKLSLVHPSPLVFDSIINTLSYLEEEMLADDDGTEENETQKEKYFFAAQDADSEGVEGLYFTFSYTEFEDLLNNADDEQETLANNMDKIKKWFRISENGNFEHNLNVISLDPQFSEEFYTQENWEIIRAVRKAVAHERKGRIPPSTDNKGVASWNFMMVSALVDVVQYSQVDIIKRLSTNLLNKVIEGIFKTFLTIDINGIKMRHSTTMPFSQPYLEDFVMFAESQLRLFEISGNSIFKQNFQDTMIFISKEFIDGDKMLTRARHAESFELYPNQEYTPFDSSFKSPVATFIMLSRRAAVLFSDREYTDAVAELIENVTHTVLKINPVSSGEALRALSYPSEVYRVMKIPRSWIQDERFIKMIPFFLTRFVLDYHDNGNDWQICTMNACELKGHGIEEFVKTLTPREASNE
ncbi:MAG: DUF255 domain-containing protein [Bacteriovorax sp.]|nr:DUF255 domain-containing protein [Bacteriovorax sp.]